VLSNLNGKYINGMTDIETEAEQSRTIMTPFLKTELVHFIALVIVTAFFNSRHSAPAQGTFWLWTP